MKVLYFFISHAAEGFQSFNIHITEFLNCANKLQDIRVIPGSPIVKSNRELGVELQFFHAFKNSIPRAVKDILSILYNLKDLLRAIGKIRSVKPDIILFRANHNNFYNVLLQKIFKIPLVLEVNSPETYERIKYKQVYFKKISLLIEKWGWDNADAIYTVSENQKNMIAGYGVPKEKIYAIHNGVNLELYNHRPSQNKKASDKITCIYVGSFRNYHNLAAIINIFSSLYEKYDNIEIKIIGTGETFDKVKKLVESAGLSNAVFLPGYIQYEKIPQYLIQSDIAFMNDFTEYGSPIKVFEYMAAKTAILVPDRKSILEILEHGKDALFFKSGDMNDFKNKLENLISKPDLRNFLADNAYGKVINNYTWDHNAQRVAGVLKKTLLNRSIKKPEK
ncbi:MAG: glycosyltransferase family 4 protein [Chitinispirillia bacterium]|jgi:glycosyltransferase involved in cell wall biosynthesis